MQKTCANCGAENPVTAKFCRRCGRPCTEQVIRSVTKPSPVMQQWRLLSHNLTRKEVRKALGEPIRIETGEPAGASTAEIWTYEYEVVNRPEEHVSGTVKLSVLEGRVLSWVEPDWHRLGAARPEAGTADAGR
jgi:hypothetical protein